MDGKSGVATTSRTGNIWRTTGGETTILPCTKEKLTSPIHWGGGYTSLTPAKKQYAWFMMEQLNILVKKDIGRLLLTITIPTLKSL